MSKVWMPVPDGEYDNVQVAGRNLSVTSRDPWSDLPDDIRLCRLAEAPDAPVVPSDIAEVMRAALAVMRDALNTPSEHFGESIRRKHQAEIDKARAWLAALGQEVADGPQTNP